MKAIKRMLLIGVAVLALLSLTGCVVISRDEPGGPEHCSLATSSPCEIISETHVVRL